ncbi:hypothetical protein [Micromonospora yangpuensis]|uniref:Uncharacterized protein n=1 Tax=Micromonospora yangpuensis TaxID=683228 RepID=A0A1C6UFJ1_9ACTN|nr:hypothetical protein [Micromonospora yangpuensis]GGM05767.1 hypothetical protein GCM10012279_24360 [Micromonospora yangpuensis]SCL52721.1 hypothetical protein GA0070617_2161 [Micromonospora yangpuensis]
MSPPQEPRDTSRRAANARARLSRRPSRLGTPGGKADTPDRAFDPTAGFPGLLAGVWQAATAQPLPEAVQTLLTLGGRIPADVQLRALRVADEVALAVLFGRSWRAGTVAADEPAEGPPAFLGELGLTTGGRVLLRVPSGPPLADEADLVGRVLRVPWSRRALDDYHDRLPPARARYADSVRDCRAWLAAAGPTGRDELLELLKEAAQRTAPFVLYQENRRYTNFREQNTLTGKTLWPGHPDCALSALTGVPLALWSDNDAVLVVCLTVLVRSAGFARIEEANSTQLTLDHVAELLERTRVRYAAVPGGEPVGPAGAARVDELLTLADALRRRRTGFGPDVQLYREIHGALMHKIERVAGPRPPTVREREEALAARLRERLPVAGADLAALGRAVAADPSWLAKPHGEFATGLESLVYETASAATTVFEVDFAMSRGMRSLPELIRALRENDWARITDWELPEFFCCVVPAAEARRHFDGSPAQLADAAWAMSARMQYNSWHFIAGNLPKVPEVAARDHFVPPAIPDIAHFSDQHHHGHLAARVRFSIRSPQPVEILGRRFAGFVDVRLLRCEGPPFTEQDLLVAHRLSGFVAAATSAAARLVADGTDLTVNAFDSQWHWSSIAAGTAAR